MFGIFGGATTVTSTCSSAIAAFTQRTTSSGSSPASIRQSISAIASGGMTLRFSLAFSMFTANVVRTIAAYQRSARNRSRKARSRSECARSSKPRLSPAGSTVPSCRKNSCTSGSTRGARSAASKRAQALTSRCGAVVAHGIEPWPGLERAVSRSGSPVFSETSIIPSGARQPASWWIPPNSPSAYSAPASQCGYCSAMKRAPKRLPASSSAVPRSTRSRLSGTPARLIASTAASCMMPMPFMSRAPRPYR